MQTTIPIIANEQELTRRANMDYAKRLWDRIEADEKSAGVFVEDRSSVIIPSNPHFIFPSQVHA